MRQKKISIVIPTLNEVENIGPLVARLDESLSGADIDYELIFIDDHSDDGTAEAIRDLSATYPITLATKAGEPGKAHSLLEGFAKAKHEVIGMIDGDLQYPPEAIAGMYGMLTDGIADIVVGERKMLKTNILRRILSGGFRTVFGRYLWGFDVDVQSGLKVFRKEILNRMSLSPEAWTFDLDFLVQARNGGYSIQGYDIMFADRTAGDVKIGIFRASFQIGKSALKLRFKPRNHVRFSSQQTRQKGRGFHFRGAEYVTHNNLDYQTTAVERTNLVQRLAIGSLLVVTTLLLLTNWHLYFLVATSVITILYFCDLLFSLFLVNRSFFSYREVSFSQQELSVFKNWPRYTVLCPLYKEERVVPQFISAMAKLSYPKNKLEVLLLLEEDDKETLEGIRAMDLPDYFHLVVVPESMPKTKPKACNYGLEHATGEYAVIYDAEDIPDPMQLKKAVLAFGKSGANVGCIQAKLNYYNWDQNLLTRLFTLEYSLWFNLILTGLQSIGAPIPLGGTSNHFRTADLKSMGGWDPFNVTEDADLGMRIAKRGMVTAILDSTTFEEANSEFSNWIKQRARWIKGYMQTYLVHTRQLRQFASSGKRRDMVTFQLVIGGKILSMLINPLLWLMTIVYFVLHAAVGPAIQSLYPTPIFYLGITALLIGNFLYFYYYMMGAVRQGRPELVLSSIFVPIYWLMMSFAAVYALRDLIIRPFHWHKTKHGLHLPHDTSGDATEQTTARAV